MKALTDQITTLSKVAADKISHPDYTEVSGDLIRLSLEGRFDVIAHGCNCFCTMGAGIAPQMAKTFGVNFYSKEEVQYKGDINKLGTIDYQRVYINLEDSKITFNERHLGENGVIFYEKNFPVWEMKGGKEVYRKTHTELHKLFIVNAYTQYGFGKNHANGTEKPLDYDALRLCMRKINHTFKGKHIGLPRIGCGLAGGDWEIVKGIIKKELKDCKVTIVNYEK